MKKILKITGLSAVIVVAAVIAVYVHTPTQKTNAATPAPTISIAFDQGSAGVRQASGQTSMSNAQLTLSSGGTFTEDFQIQICVTSDNAPFQFCGTTPWASASGGSTEWSPWIWPGYNNGLNITTPGLITLTVNTRPLPAGTTLGHVVLGLGIAEANGGPLASNIVHSSPCDYGFTPGGGGSTPNVYGYVYGSCPSTWEANPATGASGSPDIIQVGISAVVLGANGTSNNIPASFNASETKTVGTDSNPLEITVENSGDAAWTSNVSTIISGSETGTCDAGNEPSPSDPEGSSCSYSVDNSSNAYELQHVSGSFTAGTDPAQYHNITSETCTVGGSDCDDSACEGDQNACTGSGYCSNGYDNDQSDCTLDGASWTNGCNSVWEPQISCVTSGDPNVEPGATAKFTLGSLTAPATAGSYTEDWQMLDKSAGGGNFGAVIPVNIQVVSAGPAPVGTITVTSEDASATSVGVPAQWDIIDGASDICGGGNVCQGSSQTYPNQPALGGSGSAGSIDMPYASISLLNASLPYSLKSVQLAPIAQKNVGVIDQILSLTQNIFGSTAEAFTIPLANPLAQTLNPGSSTAFVILWDPIADVAVSPVALPLSATAGGTTNGQVQITNTGAPGSTLTWSSSVSYTNGSGWLSVSPSADSSGLTNGASGNASEDATITADASGLSPGTYTGTVTFTGVSNTPSPFPLSSVVTVSFTVTPPSAGTISGVTVNCSPSSVSTNGNSTCSATVTGTGGYSSAVTWHASAGTIDSSGNYTAPASAVVATITATSQQDPTQSGTTSVTVTGSGGGPYFSCGGRVCAETATPGATSCDAACGLSSAVTPVVTCSPSSITTSQTSQCTIDLNGVPQSTATWTVSGGSGSVNSGGTYTPSGVGTATVNGTLPDGSSAGTTVTTTAPSGPPTCDSASCQATCNAPVLNASPNSIVVPESSSLTYGCSNVTECTLTGGGLNSTQTLPSQGTITGNATTTPSVTTVYTVTCSNGGYAYDSTSTTVQVTVGGSSLCEQNPNGAGCSGQ